MQYEWQNRRHQNTTKAKKKGSKTDAQFATVWNHSPIEANLHCRYCCYWLLPPFAGNWRQIVPTAQLRMMMMRLWMMRRRRKKTTDFVVSVLFSIISITASSHAAAAFAAVDAKQFGVRQQQPVTNRFRGQLSTLDFCCLSSNLQANWTRHWLELITWPLLAVFPLSVFTVVEKSTWRQITLVWQSLSFFLSVCCFFFFLALQPQSLS